MTTDIRKRILLVYSMIMVSIMGGLIYGFSLFKQNLVKEGSTLTEKEFGFVYGIASGGQLVSSFVFGLMRDQFGTQRIVLLSLSAVLAGSIGCAFCSSNSVWQLSISLLLLELGSGVQICMMPIAELFDQPAVILALLTGSFNISVVVFLFLFSVFKDRRGAFGAYGITTLLLAIVGYMILPLGPSYGQEEEDLEQEMDIRHSNKVEEVKMKNQKSASNPNLNYSQQKKSFPEDTQVEEDQVKVHNYTSRMSRKRRSSLLSDFQNLDKEILEEGLDSVVTSKLSALQQLTSVEYVAALVWFTMMLIPLQYYVYAIDLRLYEIEGSDRYVWVFTLCFATVSTIFGPLCGLIVDYIGIGFSQTLATGMASIPFFLLLLNKISFQIVGIALYCIGRTFIFSLFYICIGATFGFDNFGVLVGVGAVTSSVFSFLQLLLIWIASKGHDKLIGMVCGAIYLVILPYCIFIGIRELSGRKALISILKEIPIQTVNLRETMKLPIAGSFFMPRTIGVDATIETTDLALSRMSELRGSSLMVSTRPGSSRTQRSVVIPDTNISKRRYTNTVVLVNNKKLMTDCKLSIIQKKI
mmetsp:Transcript_22068/g.44251  ORF Transcript_22068/g.44251 Transcript_22068/m.44251 type:complete len:583 (-) Transcript_22068:214-1962(-)